MALTFVPLLSAILYKEGRMVSAESFGAAKTMQASSKVVNFLTYLLILISTCLSTQVSA